MTRTLNAMPNARNADTNGTNGNKPTVISLFAGCGGSSLGYKMAGYQELAAAELNDMAARTFKANFPGVPVLKINIADLNKDAIATICGGKAIDDLDVLDGSPPCQGYSSSGKSDVADARNALFSHNVRLINELHPKAFVIENVPGMMFGKMRGMFKENMKLTKSTGYVVKCFKLNAAFYGVPQARERLVWIGSREYCDITAPPLSGKPISVEKALAGIGVQRKEGWSGAMLNEYWQKAGFGKPVGKFRSRKKLHPKRPAYTQCAGSSDFHWAEPREMTLREYVLLQTFPDDFIWPESRKAAMRMIGNSVPPKFMYHIAKHVKETILA